MSIHRIRSAFIALTALVGFLLPALPVEAKPVKVHWLSVKQMTEDLLEGGMVTVEFEVDQTAQLEVWITPSLEGIIEVEEPDVDLYEVGEIYELKISLAVELAEVGHSVGGTVHMQENGATRAKPLPVSLKYQAEEEEQEDSTTEEELEDEELEDESSVISWEPDELSSDLFTDGMVTVQFTTSYNLGDFVVWPTPSLDCLEIEDPEMVEGEEGLHELKITLVDEDCHQGGTIHIRELDGEKMRRTWPLPLPVNLGTSLTEGEGVEEVEGEQEEVVPGVVVGAADFQAEPVAAGQIVSVFGEGMGPDVPASLQIDGDGTVSDYLADTLVLFDGFPAPLLSSSDGQLNVIVPNALAGRSHAEMIVTYRGKVSAPFLVPITTAAPGLFTLDASGHGRGAILNQDLTVNSFSNPALPGSVIVLYGTGAGPLDGADEDGQIVGNELALLELPVEVLIDGVKAQMLYAGGAPGLVNGVVQLNVRLPFTARSGSSVPVTFVVDGVATDSSVTVAIQ